MKSITAYVLSMLLALAAAAETAESASTFRGSTPFKSWETNSPDNNPWSGGATAGAIIGFSLFGVSYIFVVIYIFMDINKSKKEYQEMVEEDKNTIKQLNVSANTLAEWEHDLALRLAGKAADDKADDQLFGAAATLTKGEYEAHM